MKLLPKNKKIFRALIPFAKKIIAICKEAGINPVIYGSFAHFHHTKDTSMKVNDIDLWIPEKKYPKLINLLKINNIKYKYFPKWHTLIIKNGKLKVEVDSIDYWYRDMKRKPFPRTFDRIRFYGVPVKIMNLNILERFYEVALAHSDKTKNKVKRRILALERFLGRKLNWK